MIYYEFWKENYVKNDKNPREMSFFSEFFLFFNENWAPDLTF